MNWLSSLEAGGELKIDKFFPLRDRVTWGTGGPAECFLRPRTRRSLREIRRIASAEGIPLSVLGGGSNVLVSDRGIPGWTLSLALLDESRGFRSEGEGWACGAGASLPGVLSSCIERGLGGLEFCAGIPGTLGGALAGNAGAWGQGIGERVLWIDAIDPEGTPRRCGAEELRWSYRRSPIARDSLILSCGLRLDREDPKVLRSRFGEFLGKRRNQPREGRTAGCVFKNPPGESAGSLLDRSGCKNMQFGGARVSACHANFIVNDGGASAKDIMEVSRRCRERVADAFGIRLEYEICFLGRFD
jgi:UDP-N-acetylmuramate dehydrogenase